MSTASAMRPVRREDRDTTSALPAASAAVEFHYTQDQNFVAALHELGGRHHPERISVIPAKRGGMSHSWPPAQLHRESHFTPNLEKQAGHVAPLILPASG
jgi:hypothetical protein